MFSTYTVVYIVGEGGNKAEGVLTSVTLESYEFCSPLIIGWKYKHSTGNRLFMMSLSESRNATIS